MVVVVIHYHLPIREGYDISKQHLILYKINSNTYRSVIKTNHGRIIYLELLQLDEIFVVNDCFYIDRKCQNKYYAVPKKLITKVFDCDKLLNVIAEELDKKYYGIEIDYSISELSTDEFIENRLKEMKKGYKFLIFTGEGEMINGIPSVIRTRFKNRLHRSILIEMQYQNGNGVIIDCHYYDRKYKAKLQVIPETLSTVYFEYTRQAILNIINNELNAAFTDIIFVTDGSLSIDNKSPLCGYII